MVWNDGAWLAAIGIVIGHGLVYPSDAARAQQRPFHDRSGTNDVFWGPSIHWNTYLEQYVMLLNRAKDDQFGQEGIYVSFSPTLLSDAVGARRRRSRSGGGWYPQVIGDGSGEGHGSHARANGAPASS